MFSRSDLATRLLQFPTEPCCVKYVNGERADRSERSWTGSIHHVRTRAALKYPWIRSIGRYFGDLFQKSTARIDPKLTVGLSRHERPSTFSQAVQVVELLQFEVDYFSGNGILEIERSSLETPKRYLLQPVSCEAG